jgi:hypothetical protein
MSSSDRDTQALRRAALLALQQGDFTRSIDQLGQHLRHHPQDTEAELELGLAELLSGDREAFITRFQKLTPQLAVAPPTVGRAQRLWVQSRRIANDMARAATILVLAGIPATAAGCAKSPPGPSEQPESGSAGPTVTVAPADSVTTGADLGDGGGEPDTGPVASASAVATASATASATATATVAATATATATTTRTRTRPYRPKTRYVAVRPSPVPNFAPPPGTPTPKSK